MAQVAGRTPIENTEDMIYSRDIIARIDYLDYLAQYVEPQDPDSPELVIPEDVDLEEVEELRALQQLAEEAADYAPDWEYGEQLIRDSYFQTYAQELAEDVCSLPTELANRWPYTCIDWEKAADELKADYAEVTYQGVSYWIRS